MRQRRDLVEHGGERGSAQHQHVDVGLGDDGCGARSAVEQGQLADDVAGAEVRDRRAVPNDLGPPGEQHDRLAADVALAGQLGSRLQRHLIGSAAE